MPNWCSNTITITGNKENICRIKDMMDSIENKSESNLFQTLVGYPDHMTEGEYQEKWYDTNVTNWGTKWDVSYDDACPQFSEEEIVLSPDTAWSPPIGFGTILAKLYQVDVELFYTEPGCDFCGKTFCNKDGDVNEEDYSYHEGLFYFDQEQFWSEMESQAEYYIGEEEKSLEEFIQIFHYVDKEEITQYYNEQKENYGKEA
jgi:hypothetical protein